MKRPNGYGTVTKLSGARRKPYAARVSAHDRKGKIVQKYLGYYETQREAWDALEAYRAKASVKAAPAPENLGITLQEVYDLWSVRKYEKAGRSSILGYQASWKRVSVLSSMPIRSIGIDQWQQIIDEDERRSLSKSSINNDSILIRALNKYAMERDWIMKDYSQFIRLPSVGAKFEKGAFTDLEVAEIARLANEGDPGAAAALVLCYTGFRINEFLSLTRFSYDPHEKTLCGGSKTKAGKDRVIPVHPRILPIIQKWYAQGGERLFLWEGKTISTDSFHKRLFTPLMKKIGREKATPHWCRHTFASRLHSFGADELCIKRLMGHSDGNVTEHYTHTTISELREAINKIA